MCLRYKSKFLYHAKNTMRPVERLDKIEKVKFSNRHDLINLGIRPDWFLVQIQSEEPREYE